MMSSTELGGPLTDSQDTGHDGDFVQSLERGLSVIRAFDPCLSCSTHADGRLALRICLVSPDGNVLDEVSR